MLAQLRTLGTSNTSEDWIERVYVRERGATKPAIEELYVVAPAGVRNKEKLRFGRVWIGLTTYADRMGGRLPSRPTTLRKPVVIEQTAAPLV